MTIRVKTKLYENYKEYWVNDDQMLKSFTLPLDSSEEEAIKIFNELPAIFEESNRLRTERELKEKQEEKEEASE